MKGTMGFSCFLLPIWCHLLEGSPLFLFPERELDKPSRILVHSLASPTPWMALYQIPSRGISFHICQAKGWKISQVQLSCFFSLTQCLIESSFDKPLESYLNHPRLLKQNRRGSGLNSRYLVQDRSLDRH